MLMELEIYELERPAEYEHGTILLLYDMSVAAFTLVFMLQDYPETHAPFTQACAALFKFWQCWPCPAPMLHELQALAQQLNIPLPPESMRYFSAVKVHRGSVEDLPFSWVLPSHTDLEELFSDDGQD
jgi:hypothetical protein